MAVWVFGVPRSTALQPTSPVMESKSLLSQVMPSLDLTPDTGEALQHLSTMLQAEQEMAEEGLYAMSQKSLSQSMDKKSLSLLREACADVRDKARLNTVMGPHAGDWLHVVPSPSLGLQLRAQEFRVSVLYRLGEPVFDKEGPCVACGQLSDRHGDHAVGCASRGERISRHNHLRDALFSTAVKAQLGPLREQRALLPGADARPADVLLPHFDGGRDMAVPEEDGIP